MVHNKRIKALREDKDLTQSDIGKLTNTNQRTISQYEKGTRQIPIEIIITLAKYFNVSTDYILGLTNNPKPYWTVKNDNSNSNNNNKTVNIEQNGNSNKIGNINL